MRHQVFLDTQPLNGTYTMVFVSSDLAVCAEVCRELRRSFGEPGETPPGFHWFEVRDRGTQMRNRYAVFSRASDTDVGTTAQLVARGHTSVALYVEGLYYRNQQAREDARDYLEIVPQHAGPEEWPGMGDLLGAWVNRLQVKDALSPPTEEEAWTPLRPQMLVRPGQLLRRTGQEPLYVLSITEEHPFLVRAFDPQGNLRLVRETNLLSEEWECHYPIFGLLGGTP